MAEPEKKPPNENSVHQRIWILALFLSIVVWYGIRAAISFDTLVTDVPIEIQLDEGWTVLERSDETADVRFRGSRGDIRDLNRDQTRIVIDMRGRADAGQQTTRLDLSRIRAPSGVRAVSIRPETLSLSLDREGERQIAVRADLQGAPPEGYEAQQWICTPASVTLRGPMARLEAVDVIRTAVVDLDGRVQSFRVRRPLLLPPNLATARLDPDRVQVDVTVLEHASTQSLEGIVVTLLTSPGKSPPVLLEPTQVTVVLQGRAETLRALEASRVRAFVDCIGLTDEDEIDLPILVHALPGVRAISISPSFARIRIRKPELRKDEL